MKYAIVNTVARKGFSFPYYCFFFLNERNFLATAFETAVLNALVFDIWVKEWTIFGISGHSANVGF